MAVTGLATVVGNGAVLLALRKVRRAPSHYPLASLAIADLLVGLFVLPIGAAREMFQFHLHRTICSFWSTLDVLCCTASILSLCALGWERWCGITAPLARAKRTKHAKIFAALVWPVSSAVALPTIFIASQKHFLPDEAPKACTVNTNVGYVFFSTFVSFYLPASVMVVLYVKILAALSTPPSIRAHRGRSPRTERPQGNPSSSNFEATKQTNLKTSFKENIKKVTVFLSPKGHHLNIPGTSRNKEPSPKKIPASTRNFLTRQRRATRTIVMLMLLFLVCWTPFFVMLPLDSLCECVPDVAWQWCTWLGYINSALNPVVYAAASPSVRRVLHKSFSTTNSTKTTDLPLTPNIRRVK